MNKKMIPIGIMVVLSFAVSAYMGIVYLIPQQHQAFAFNNQQFQSSLIIPGSNAGDEPITTL